MNPATAVQSMPRPMVNDIARPAPRPIQPAPLAQPALQAQPVLQAQPISAPAPAPSPAPAQALTTNLVTNIPVHNPHSPANPANEDTELDKIMRDVGKELKKDDHNVKKGHHSLFSRKAKQAAPVAIRPNISAPAAAPIQTAPAQQAAPVAQPAASAHPIKPSASTKPKSGSTAPVMVIMMTILVTGLLMAAAVYTYK